MSLSTSTQMSAYLLLRTGSQTKVGLAVGAQGVANLASAFPGAFLGDRYGRKVVIRTAVAIGAVGFAAMVLGINAGLAPSREFLAIAAALLTIGIYQGSQNPSVEAIFADSIVSGNRSSLYAKKQSLRILGNASGPVVAVCAFAYLGNDWKATELRYCISAGAALFVVPAVFALSLSEKKSLGAASEALVPTKKSNNNNDEKVLVIQEEKDEPPPKTIEEEEKDGAPVVPADEEIPAAAREFAVATRRRIASTVVLCDLVLVFGAGFSVRFIPLFLIERCHLSPIAVNLIAAAGPLGASACAILAQKASKVFGRVQVTFLTKAAGLLCILGLACTRNTYLIVGLYVVRVWLNNCGTGLTKSILNDYVTKKERARWNSAEAVNNFG